MTWKYTSRQAAIAVKKVARVTDLDGEFPGYETRAGALNCENYRRPPCRSWKFRSRCARQFARRAA
jgi:hypothetical protein